MRQYRVWLTPADVIDVARPNSCRSWEYSVPWGITHDVWCHQLTVTCSIDDVPGREHLRPELDIRHVRGGKIKTINEKTRTQDAKGSIFTQ